MQDLQVDDVSARPSGRSARLALFGPPPLIDGDDGEAYDELLARITGVVKSADVLEEIWVRDAIDLVWESFRLRRLKANLMRTAAPEGLERILRRRVDQFVAADLAQKWAKNDANAVARVDRLLAEMGVGMEAVMAATLSVKLGDIERIDRMTALAEARRNAHLREVDRHRASVALRLRRAAGDAERAADAEFEVIEAGRGANATIASSRVEKEEIA